MLSSEMISMFSVFIETVIRNVEQPRNRGRVMWHAIMAQSPVLTFVNYSFLGFITYSVLILCICILIQSTVLYFDHGHCEWCCLLLWW